MSCLLTPSVTGYSRVPEPPARMIPFIRTRDDITHAAASQSRSLSRARPTCRSPCVLPVLHDQFHNEAMARPAARLPENVPGPFFVDDSCIDCAVCRHIQPAVFARSARDLSFVARQPSSDEE